MKKINVHPAQPENLLEVFKKEGIYLPAYCAGQGTCGKCRVRFTANAPEEITAEEKNVFSEAELADGWRLACRHTVSGGVSLEVEGSDEAEMEAAVDFTLGDAPGYVGEKTDEAAPKQAQDRGAAAFLAEGEIVAVDIGTTTIAASLLSRKTGEVVQTAAMVNHQRAYGADVISRINASVHGKKEILKECIREDIAALLRELSVTPEKARLIISANTTMQHLLQGLPCETLGLAPYTPFDITMHPYENMLILPGISTYVGADIVSGIVACGIDRRKELSILVDLGTNGEMAIGNQDRILAASTAAGPAFEGGNISCGMAGVPGAISSVKIDGDAVSLQTIGNQPPVGLCGTGVLETVYELYANEIIDETGLYDDEYLEEGFALTDDIRFLAKDVREIQLAKSAIRAGLEVLIKQYGAGYDDIDRVYIAGGFGQKVDIKKAVGIGLFPEELADRITAVGNSSLAGAVLLGKHPELAGRFQEVVAKAEEIDLASHPDFNDLYIDYMFFDE